MKRTTTKPKRAPAKPAPATEAPWLRYHPEFGMMSHDLDIGIAILMLHDATGGFEILGPVASISQERDSANSNGPSLLPLRRADAPALESRFEKVGRKSRNSTTQRISPRGTPPQW